MTDTADIRCPVWGVPPKVKITTREALWWHLKGMFGVTIPRTQVCDDHVSPFEALAEAFFAEVPVSLWIGSRGFGGKSFLLSALAVAEAENLGAQVTLLGGSGAQSLNIHEHTGNLWDFENAPKAKLAMERTKYDTHLINKGHIRSLMASATSVRGPHPQRLRLDEIDEMDLEILQAAQGQPMRKFGIETQTVMSSTHQHAEGTVTEMLKRAKDSGWPCRRWCFLETSNPIDGWLTPEEVERKRTEIPQRMWETEYMLGEPSLENRTFNLDLLHEAFSATVEEHTGEQPVVLRKVEEGSTYVTGVDWAKQKDMTVISTFDTSRDPWVCVAWQKVNRLPWSVMVTRAWNQWQHYGGQIIHDATGIGNVVDDLLKDMSHRSLHRKIIPFVMTGGRTRTALFSEYVAAIEHGHMQFPMIQYAYNEHRFCGDDDLFGKGHPPDSIVSGALAWSIRKKNPVIVMPVQGTTRRSPWVV